MLCKCGSKFLPTIKGQKKCFTCMALECKSAVVEVKKIIEKRIEELFKEHNAVITVNEKSGFKSKGIDNGIRIDECRTILDLMKKEELIK